MAAGDAGHTGSNDAAVPPTDGVAVDWVNHFANADSRPVVVDGTVFLWDGARNLHELDLETGAIGDSIRFPWGQTYSPTVADGRFHVGIGHSIFGTVVFVSEPGADEDPIWEHELEWQLTSSPTVVDDVVCFRTTEGLRAMDADDGSERWSLEIGRGRDTPAAADGTIYAVDDSGDEGTVYALDAATGAEQWTWSGTVVSDRVVVADGIAYVATEEDGSERTVVALAADTGDERWRTTLEGQRIAQPFTVDDDAVYVVIDGSWGDHQTVYALDVQTGDERWQYDLEWTSTVGQPVVAADTVYVPTDEETVHAVDATDGSHRWTATVPVGDDPTLALADDRLLVAGTSLVALQPGDETALDYRADGLPVDWRYDHGGDYAPEFVSIVDDAAMLGAEDALFAFDPTDGETAWDAALESDGEESDLAGPTAEHDGTTYVATEGGLLAAFDADADEPRWRTTLETGIETGVAAGDGGVAVVTADDELVAVDHEGTVTWRQPIADGVASAPAVAGHTVAVEAESPDSGTLVYGLAADTGDERWTIDPGVTDESDPVGVDGMVLVGGDELQAIEASDGTEHWTIPLENTMRGATAADGVLYVATGESRAIRSPIGAVTAVEAASGERRWSRRIGAVHASPTVIAGTVYAATREGTAYALAGTDGELLAWRHVGSGASSLAGVDETLLVAFEDPAIPVALDTSDTVTQSLDLPWPEWAASDTTGESGPGGGSGGGTTGGENESDGETSDDDSTPGFGVLGTAAGLAGAGLYRRLASDADTARED